MKNVNLLPESGPPQRVESVRRWTRPVVLGAVLIGTAAWFVAGWAQARALDARIRALDTAALRAEQMNAAAEEIELECEQLREATRTAEQLRPRIPSPSALSLVTTLSPSGIVYDRLVVEQVKPSSRTSVHRPRLLITVEGTSSDEERLVDYMTRLSESPFLENLHLRKSHAARVDASLGCQFFASLEMVTPRIAETRGGE